jgi:hypothetical protein
VHIHTDNTHNATSGSSVSPNGLGAEHNARMFCGKMRRSAAARQRSSKLDWHDLDGDFLVHSSQNKLRNQLAVLTECARRRGGEAATRARRHRRVRCSPSSMAWRLSNPAQVYGMAPRTGGRKAQFRPQSAAAGDRPQQDQVVNEERRRNIFGTYFSTLYTSVDFTF